MSMLWIILILVPHWKMFASTELSCNLTYRSTAETVSLQCGMNERSDWSDSMIPLLSVLLWPYAEVKKGHWKQRMLVTPWAFLHLCSLRTCPGLASQRSLSHVQTTNKTSERGSTKNRLTKQKRSRESRGDEEEMLRFRRNLFAPRLKKNLNIVKW